MKTKTLKRNINNKRNNTRKNKSIDYIIAIPTYKRYSQVYDKSIKTLIQHKVNPKKIYIFVANKEEEKLYKKNLPPDSYYKIIIGVLGINNQRKFMINYFKQGTNVVFIDDDVERIEELKNDKLKEINNVDRFIKEAFQECYRKNIYLWGVYPVRNPFFMKPRPIKNYGLRFILGTFYGQIIRHSKDLITSLPEKEDVENSILHYKKDCGVLRFDKVTIKTKFYNPEGGIYAMTKDRKTIHKKAAMTLSKKYPEYGSIWIRNNGIYEFKLKSLPYKC